MPIVIKYNSPALVAASAAGVGNYRAADQNFDRSQAANAAAVGQSIALTNQMRQGQSLQQQQLNQQDALALDQYGQQLHQFNTDRAFNADQQRYTAGVQMDENQKRQAVQQVITMANMGQLDAATAERWIGIAQQGGNPFAGQTTSEQLGQEQRQLEAQQLLNQQRGEIQMQTADMRVGGQLAVVDAQGQNAMQRTEATNSAALERERVRQEAISSRTNASGESPAQARLAANDAYSRQTKAASVGVEIAKDELKQIDADIADLSADSNVYRANDAKRQGDLDKLHTRRAEVRTELGDAQRSLKELAAQAPGEGAKRTATGGPATRPASTQPAATSAVVDVTDDAGYAALPSGTKYRHPDGSIRMKP